MFKFAGAPSSTKEAAGVGTVISVSTTNIWFADSGVGDAGLGGDKVVGRKLIDMSRTAAMPAIHVAVRYMIVDAD